MTIQKPVKRLRGITSRHVRNLMYAIAGFNVIGALLDGLFNAISLADSGWNFILIGVILFLWAGLEIYLSKYSLNIINKHGEQLQVINLGAGPRIGMLSAIILLLATSLIPIESKSNKMSEELALRFKVYLEETNPELAESMIVGRLEFEKILQDYKTIRSQLARYEATTDLEKMALEHFDTGDFSKSIMYFEQLKNEEQYQIDLHSRKKAEASYYLGLIHDMFLEFNDAQFEYENALELDSNNISYLNSYGELLFRISDENSLIIEVFEKSLELSKEKFGVIDSMVGTAMNNLAAIYIRDQQFGRGIPLMEEAARISTSTRGEKNPLTIEIIDNLSEVYFTTGEKEKAIEYGSKALELGLSTYGPFDLRTAYIYNNLGAIYQQIGTFEKAAFFLERGLQIREKWLDPSDPDLAYSNNNLGANFYFSGQYQKANQYYTKALTIWKENFGNDHREIANTLCNIGVTHLEMGSLQLAEDFIQQSLQMRKELLGNQAIGTAISLGHLGRVRFQQNRFSEALDLHLSEKNILEELAGLSHPKTATCYTNLGRTYLRLDQIELAFEFCQTGHQLLLEYIEFAHPVLARSFLYMGEIYLSQNKPSQATEAKENALEMFKELYGENHPVVTEVKSNAIQY